VSVRDTSVTDAERCEIDFMKAMCLLRRRPGKWQGFNLSKSIGRSLFLPKGNRVACDISAYKESEIRF